MLVSEGERDCNYKPKNKGQFTAEKTPLLQVPSVVTVTSVIWTKVGSSVQRLLGLVPECTE